MKNNNNYSGNFQKIKKKPKRKDYEDDRKSKNRRRQKSIRYGKGY